MNERGGWSIANIRTGMRYGWSMGALRHVVGQSARNKEKSQHRQIHHDGLSLYRPASTRPPARPEVVRVSLLEFSQQT